MKLYLFHNIEKEFAKEFKEEILFQNLRIAQTLSIVTFCLCFMIRFFDFVIDFSAMLTFYDNYVFVNTYFLSIGLSFALLFFLIRTQVKTQMQHRFEILLWVFAFLFICGCIWVSFVAQANPKNTLALLVLGMLSIAGLFVFPFIYTFFLALLSLIIFTVGLGAFQTDINQWLLNYVSFSIILIGFMVFSRVLYSYHVGYFIKVKTIETANREIKQANQWKDEILSVVAHDLRSPLSNIQSLIELMNHTGTTESEKQIYISHIKTSCIKADFIIKEILVAAQEESKDEWQQLHPENLNVLLMDIQRTWLKVVNGSRTIQLLLPQQEVILPIYKGKLQRVLDNLINNAIKFTQEHKGAIFIELKQEADGVFIIVRDNGIGIPNHLLPYLFDKFSSAGRNGLKNEPSVGLGLYISKQLVEKHSGKLWVETAEDKGSSFYIHLPFQTTT